MPPYYEDHVMQGYVKKLAARTLVLKAEEALEHQRTDKKPSAIAVSRTVPASPSPRRAYKVYEAACAASALAVTGKRKRQLSKAL